MNLSKEKQSQLKYYAKEIGKLLREENLGKYSTFEEGEKILREELLNHVNPEVAQNAGCCSTPFCESKELEKLNKKNKRKLLSLVGEFELPNYKLKELGVKHQGRYSPGVERTCLILAANKSYPQSEKDLKILTGLSVSKNSFHRGVQRYKEPEENVCKEEVSEIAVDGGSVCLKSGKNQQFKTARINKRFHIVRFKEDKSLIEKLEKLFKKESVYLLGDGHDGVWNIFKELRGGAAPQVVTK